MLDFASRGDRGGRRVFLKIYFLRFNVSLPEYFYQKNQNTKKPQYHNTKTP